MRSPILWYGGKGNVKEKLLGLMPSHLHYVEVFGGGASLLFAKEPAGGIEVFNDIDGNLVNLFRVLRDPGKFERFHQMVSLTPYARSEYYECRDLECEDDVERARRFFVVARMSFSGQFGTGWSYAVSNVNRGMAGTTSKYLSIIEELPEIHARLMRVQIENLDFREIIPKYGAAGTLLYCDPPYPKAVKSKLKKYEHEMADKDHEDMVALLLEYPQAAMLSGYANPLYDVLEDRGWVRFDFETACHAVGKTRLTGNLGKDSMQTRIESVWLNPQAELGAGQMKLPGICPDRRQRKPGIESREICLAM